MRFVALAVAAAALLAGCSGGDDEESTPATTATQTVTVRESTPTETAAAPDRAGSLADAVERVLPSVVNVQTTSFGGGEGEASGVILQRDGLILTNNHVVEGTTGITIAFNDGVHKTPLEGTVIGTAPERDLAVVRVEASDLIPVELARSSALRLGDVVIALGFPAGLGGPTVTSGHRLRARPHDRGPERRPDRAAPDRRGDQPGQLRRAARRPVGAARRDQHGRDPERRHREHRLRDRDRRGAARDRPASATRRRRRRRWLGIAFSSVDSESAAVQLGLDSSTRGAAVTVVYPGGPADKADMAVGDVIIAADDVPIRNANALAKLIAERKIGDELDLELIDSRGPRLVTVEVARRTPGALP